MGTPVVGPGLNAGAWARRYLDRGWCPLPIPFKTKIPAC